MPLVPIESPAAESVSVPRGGRSACSASLRVLHVTQAYYPFLDRGGPAVKVRALAQGLARRGSLVTVVTSDLGLAGQGNSINALPEPRGWRSLQDSVETIYLRSFGSYRSLTWNPGIFQFCRSNVGSFDVVHIFGLYDLFGPAVARACRRSGIPYVLEPMGMYRPIVRSVAVKRAYHRWVAPSMVSGAARLIATSSQERQELLEEGIAADKLVVRRNGIESPESIPPVGAFRRQWKIPPDCPLVLFLGRLVSKKSPDLLLEAFAQWQQNSPRGQSAVLVLAGPEEGDGYRRTLETAASRLGLTGRVLFPGPLYDAAKWSAYRDADVFVLPSHNENFGNTVAEAVACGTPVLLTNCCGVAPLVDKRAGLAVPHDREALAASLGHLLDHPGLRERLKHGCAAVAGELSWDEPLSETEALYAELLTQAGKAGRRVAKTE